MIGLILSIALLGLIIWVIVTYVPMPQAFRTAIVVIGIILIILYVMGAVGFVDMPIPRVR